MAIYPSQCYQAANALVGLAQTIGLVPELCDPDGPYPTVYASLVACTIKYATATTTAAATITAIERPASYCSVFTSRAVASALNASKTSAAVASLCASYASVGSSPAASLDLTCSQFPSSTSTSQTSAAETTTQTPSSIPTSPPSLGTGAIAGIAVGATIAGVATIALIAFFIWRHRRVAKKRRHEAVLTPADQNEKAQLHGDSYHAEREELAGSKVPQKVRVVPGLNELEHYNLKQGCGEMSANEPAARELSDNSIKNTDDGSRSTSKGTGSTTLTQNRIHGSSS